MSKERARLDVANAANEMIIAALRERNAELEKDKLLLVEDRARFPDQPDMIGKMIGCNSQNKDNLIRVHKKAYEAQRFRADIGINKIAELEKEISQYKAVENWVRCFKINELEAHNLEQRIKAFEYAEKKISELHNVEGTLVIDWFDYFKSDFKQKLEALREQVK